jgi:hypothetical protein
MPDSEYDRGDRAMLWFNIIGISVAAVLFGLFFWYGGADLLGLLFLLFGNNDPWRDH